MNPCQHFFFFLAIHQVIELRDQIRKEEHKNKNHFTYLPTPRKELVIKQATLENNLLD